MTVTKDDLQEFNRFANERLADGGAESLQEVLDEWNARREQERSVAGIRESVAQYEAGEAVPVDEAFSEVRKKIADVE